MSDLTANDAEEEKSDNDGHISDHSSESEGDENSDAEDVFLNIEPSAIADKTVQGQRCLAICLLQEHLKEEVTMPFQSDFCAMDFDKVLESRT